MVLFGVVGDDIINVHIQFLKFSYQSRSFGRINRVYERCSAVSV